MSVYDELNADWQIDWNKEKFHLDSNVKEDYFSRKIEFLNGKLENLKQNDPRKFNQYCGDFYSVQNSKRKAWGVINAAFLGVGVGLVASALLGITVTPMFLGALATVAVAKSISFVKYKRYKLSCAIIKVLRGEKKEISYFKLFRKNKEESHFHNVTRDQFLTSEDYPVLLKACQIPPAIEQHFKDSYYPASDVIDVTPVLVTETDVKNAYVLDVAKEEPKQQTNVNARKWFNILAPILGIFISAVVNSSSGKQISAPQIKSPINPQKSEMSL